jgi:hypothetical protein
MFRYYIKMERAPLKKVACHENSCGILVCCWEVMKVYCIETEAVLYMYNKWDKFCGYVTEVKEMWKGWEINMAEKREGDRGMEGLK